MYFHDPAYRDKDGTFIWDRVPWRHRLALEAMVKMKMLNDATSTDSAAAADELAERGEGDPGASRLCVKTPSSGPFKICPTAQRGEGAPSGWCSRRSWDICIPRKVASGISEQTLTDAADRANANDDTDGERAVVAESEYMKNEEEPKKHQRSRRRIGSRKCLHRRQKVHQRLR